MSYPQFQAASDYLGAIADEDYVKALPSNSYEDRGGAVLDGPEAGYNNTSFFFNFMARYIRRSRENNYNWKDNLFRRFFLERIEKSNKK